MSRCISIGIDPGKAGGIAILSDGEAPRVWPMPLAGGDIDIAALQGLLTPGPGKEYGAFDGLVGTLGAGNPARIVVSLEKAQAMPKQGVSSTFSYGMGYGMVRGVVTGLGLRLELVTPQAWKKHVLAGSAKDKEAAIAYVRRAFPTVNLLATPRSRTPHDGIADAVCLAEFGRRSFFGAQPS